MALGIIVEKGRFVRFPTPMTYKFSFTIDEDSEDF
jgi:hypothetical protein